MRGARACGILLPGPIRQRPPTGLSGGAEKARGRQKRETGMIDTFSLLLSHGLIALAFWRLLPRTDLDRDIPPPEGEGEPDGSRRRDA